jgi:hypothetical protein
MRTSFMPVRRRNGRNKKLLPVPERPVDFYEIFVPTLRVSQ